MHKKGKQAVALVFSFIKKKLALVLAKGRKL
jgi:hypothetical protein